MEKYFIIAGYGKYRYIKKVSLKKAKELEEEDKMVYHSHSEAKEELESLKR